MSTTLVYLNFFAMSIALLRLSMHVRVTWSGTGYSHSRRRYALLLIMPSAFLHYNHAFTGEILFTDIVGASPLKLISFPLAFAYVCCIPSHKQKQPVLAHNRKKNTIRLKTPRPPKTNYYEELFFQAIKLIILVGIIAGVCAMISIRIAAYFFPSIAPVPYYVIATVFIFFATLYSIGLYRLKKERGYTL